LRGADASTGFRLGKDPPSAREKAPARDGIVEQIADRVPVRAAQGARIFCGAEVEQVPDVERDREAGQARDGEAHPRRVEDAIRNPVGRSAAAIGLDSRHHVDAVAQAHRADRVREVADEVLLGPARERRPLAAARDEAARALVRGRERGV
jgi:hypothetical protein